MSETNDIPNEHVFKHLAELKAANIIQGSIEQNAYCYCINPTELNKISIFIQNLIVNPLINIDDLILEIILI